MKKYTENEERIQYLRDGLGIVYEYCLIHLVDGKVDNAKETEELLKDIIEQINIRLDYTNFVFGEIDIH